MSLLTYCREGPQRIVCLTEETTDTLYLLGESHRIAGISGFTCRPKEARKKPKVSAFTSAKIDRILELRPDLVIGFSDLQAPIAQDLIEAGINVLVFNQRSIGEILEMVLALSRLVAAEAKGLALIAEWERGLTLIREAAADFPWHPRVFFEEWSDPLISGIRWVDELIELAGGAPVFPEFREQQAATGRIVTPERLAEANPDVILASWCGRKANKAQIRRRTPEVAAVRNGHVYEIKSTYILQPGPASLTEGVRQLHAIFAHVAGGRPAAGLAPEEKMDPDFARGR